VLRKLVLIWRFARRRTWSPERVQALQNELVSQVAEHAYAKVPFYREWFDKAGISCGSIQSVEDLQRIPVVTKRDLRACPLEGRVAQGVDVARSGKVQTSGSTGIPTTVVFSREDAVKRGALWFLAAWDLGQRPFDRVLAIRHEERFRRSWRRRLGPGSWLRRVSNEQDALGVAARFKPDVLLGMPSELYLLSQRLTGYDRRGFQLRLIISGAEMVSPPLRKSIEDAFRAPMRMLYACWEFGVIAAECLVGNGYHLVSDHLVVECLKNGKPALSGEAGELVITDLTARTMPFIRFQLGDVGLVRHGPCACGRSGTTITSLQGRSDDFLKLPDGRMISPFHAATPLYRLETVLQYRIIQVTPDSYRIEYEGKEELDAGKQDEIRSYYAKHLQASSTILERVERIEPEPSGKIRKVISLIGGPLDSKPR
jgi:phenylacetate-CoA ligase